MRDALRRWLILWLVGAGLSACSDRRSDAAPTVETRELLSFLREIPRKGLLFGHHDDPVYGIGWDGDADRSDVREVCGDYPAMMSFDLGRIEQKGPCNLDNIPLERIRREMVRHYERGGVVSLSWHADNPVTGGDAWDVSDSTVVAAILPGGSRHAKFMGWLETVAGFLQSLQTADGTLVPVIFRPWHEHTGSWFWWGQDLCSTEEYKALWRMTHDYLRQKGLRHLLYAYSPGVEPGNAAAYLERYPGDEWVDIIGFDYYQKDRGEYLENMHRMLSVMTEVGKKHGKVMAVTETGYEAIPDSLWWTETLLPVVTRYPVSYVLVWRNARERPDHYYAPYPGQVSAADFVRFYQDDRTLFLQDIANSNLKNSVKR